MVRDKKTFPFNLTTAEGKRKFEDYVKDYNEKLPGALAPVGENFGHVFSYSITSEIFK